MSDSPFVIHPPPSVYTFHQMSFICFLSLLPCMVIKPRMSGAGYAPADGFPKVRSFSLMAWRSIIIHAQACKCARAAKAGAGGHLLTANDTCEHQAFKTTCCLFGLTHPCCDISFRPSGSSWGGLSACLPQIQHSHQILYAFMGREIHLAASLMTQVSVDVHVCARVCGGYTIHKTLKN